jgi:hypothetical protein
MMMMMMMIIIIIIIIIIIKSGNSLEVGKQNVCIYKNAVYIIMRNVKIIIIIIIKSIY